MANGTGDGGGGIINTAAGTMTAATVAPTIKWLLLGLPSNSMPESTPLLLGAIAIIAIHAAEQVASAWWQRKIEARAVRLAASPPGGQP